MTLTFISAEGGLGRLEYISVRTVAAAQTESSQYTKNAPNNSTSIEEQAKD